MELTQCHGQEVHFTNRLLCGTYPSFDIIRILLQATKSTNNSIAEPRTETKIEIICDDKTR